MPIQKLTPKYAEPTSGVPTQSLNGIPNHVPNTMHPRFRLLGTTTMPRRCQHSKRLFASRANPGIVRASALFQLSQTSFDDALVAATSVIDSPDPQLRVTAAGIIEYAGGANGRAILLEHVEPLLYDPVASVRIEAARILAAVEPSALQPESRPYFDAAIKSYRDGLLADSDQSAAHLSLGILEERFARAERSRQRLEKAASHYRDAIRVQT